MWQYTYLPMGRIDWSQVKCDEQKAARWHTKNTWYYVYRITYVARSNGIYSWIFIFYSRLYARQHHFIGRFKYKRHWHFLTMRRLKNKQPSTYFFFKINKILSLLWIVVIRVKPWRCHTPKDSCILTLLSNGAIVLAWWHDIYAVSYLLVIVFH